MWSNDLVTCSGLCEINFPQNESTHYMIDEEIKTWLVEVNAIPCLELFSPLFAKIIPSVSSKSNREFYY